MTVQDFIVIYNETFKYIDKKYGKYMVYDLWETISREWCLHLRKLVEEKGIEGAYEYWGGDRGTLGREEATYEITLEEDRMIIEMNKCPSVGELKERKRNIYPDYCEHCAALYDPVLRKYDLTMEVNYERDKETGLPSGRCESRINKI